MIGHWLTNVDQYECVFNDLAIIDWLIDSDGWVSFYWTGRECLRWSQLEISLLSYSWSDMISSIKNLNTVQWDIEIYSYWDFFSVCQIELIVRTFLFHLFFGIMK